MTRVLLAVAALLVVAIAMEIPYEIRHEKFNYEDVNPFLYKNHTIGIVGGESVEAPNTFGWTVALLGSGSGSQFCGGSIINSKWILTAAHCVSNGGRYRIKAGSLDKRASNGGGKVYDTGAAIRYPGYNPSTLAGDFAVIPIVGEIEMDTVTFPIQLATPADDKWDESNTDAFTTGWGAMSEGGAATNFLRWVDVPLTTNVECGRYYSQYNIDQTMICAGIIGPCNGQNQPKCKDACQGDSGGPMAINPEGTWIQVGVVSWGIGCARPDNFGVYGRVSYANKWISDTIGA
mmetsp:Transcript_12399/g.13720  ORF Transcript_12399/g.13720 Transcript_12399/m.13720 type:complete len:290 (+) Transcript_12399:1004-1873(+)|eukprot:CAMPEP_0168522458 /NCGR_PEP_ID=MMETSP0405-20121227/9361_1 /TAXON_ID=498012 /ORGANISM="Trichosphaerium sp, Strain Am-I-7 wt" /LENGTH=289 /DNA_ID=CAMNT_0008544067 /DNA_START=47 /DNA_END=916 /DNA_ORIENTATION=+